MDIELFISPQYRQEREEIMQNLLDWALDTEDDPEPLLAHFIEEEKGHFSFGQIRNPFYLPPS